MLRYFRERSGRITQKRAPCPAEPGACCTCDRDRGLQRTGWGQRLPLVMLMNEGLLVADLHSKPAVRITTHVIHRAIDRSIPEANVQT